MGTTSHLVATKTMQMHSDIALPIRNLSNRCNVNHFDT
jgi:hypothetical protein